MKYFKVFKLHLCITVLIITTALAKQDDWKDILTLFPFIENENPIYTRNHHPVAAHFVDNLLKRQETNVDPRAKMSPKRCSSCCCKPSDYKPRDIFVDHDIFLTVMEVNECHSTCTGYQMCRKEASSLSWSKFTTSGIFDNTTMVYTSCSCVS